MSDELRQAAAELLAAVMWCDNGYCSLCHGHWPKHHQTCRGKRLEAYLAEHPADGDRAKQRAEVSSADVRSAIRRRIQAMADNWHNATEWDQRSTEEQLGFSPMDDLVDGILEIVEAVDIQWAAESHPADGDELIDEKWLREIGFRESESPYGYVLRIALKWKIAPNPTYLVLAVPPNITDSPWELVSELGDGETEGTMIAEQITTRNELRRLLAALGVV